VTVDRRDLLQHADRCCSCHARIVWARTATGERMPVDERATGNGNVLLMVQGGHLAAGVLTHAEAARRRAGGMALYISHFATCPNAGRHRRR